MRRFPIPAWLIAASLATLLAGGCATGARPAGGDAAASADEQGDPYEDLNRKVFAVNQALDRAVIKPVAKAWRDVLPEPVRDRIRAFVDNLHEPLVFANDLLQGRGQAAGITGRRFLINSTLGFGGLWDRASAMGETRQSGDFGQTLYAWGLADGPYLMLPFFGPSNVRDAIGLGVDSYTSPAGRIGSETTRRDVGLTVGVADGIDLRSRNLETLDAIESTSIDFYAYLRSVSRQHRQATLREAGGGAAVGEDLADPGLADPGETPPAAPLPQSPQAR